MKYHPPPICQKAPLLQSVLPLFFSLSACALLSAATKEETKEDMSFLSPPRTITATPDAAHQAESRRFQGIPSITRTAGGRLWAIWYAGPGGGEDQTNYVVLATSTDDGKTWLEPALIIDTDGDGPVRAFDPELWIDPLGRLWVFWAQAVGHNGSVSGTWALIINDPENPLPSQAEPRRLTNGVMMCKPIVLSNGEWGLPVSTWRKTDDSAKFVLSKDQGKTWEVRGAVNIPVALRNYDEHMVVERKDGSLWMLVRLNVDEETKKSGKIPYCIGESTSQDGGKTWSPITEPGKIPHTRSRFFITRLASGNLLFVKHADNVPDRTRLTAYISTDEGKTWQGGLVIEEGGCSYPDGVQAPDGRIFVIYDRDRGKGVIDMAIFTEEDAIAGRIVSDQAKLHIPVASLPQSASSP